MNGNRLNRELEHALKNYLAIILGYTDLLLQEIPEGDPRLPDVREIHAAASSAAALLGNAGAST
jgi:hypothetical protein